LLVGAVAGLAVRFVDGDRPATAADPEPVTERRVSSSRATPLAARLAYGSLGGGALVALVALETVRWGLVSRTRSARRSASRSLGAGSCSS